MPPANESRPSLSTVTKGSNLAISLISLSIDGNVSKSSAVKVDPGPTPRVSKLTACPVTIISSIFEPPSWMLRVYSPPRLV